jgi:hypothetical protein
MGAPNLKTAFAGGTMALALALTPTAASHADGRGARVFLSYGQGVDEMKVNDAASVLSAKGCPTVVRAGGAPPNMVKAETKGRKAVMSDAADAAGWALDNCQ